MMFKHTIGGDALPRLALVSHFSRRIRVAIYANNCIKYIAKSTEVMPCGRSAAHLVCPSSSHTTCGGGVHAEGVCRASR